MPVTRAAGTELAAGTLRRVRLVSTELPRFANLP
jgi:hypothetical protein